MIQQICFHLTYRKSNVKYKNILIEIHFFQNNNFKIIFKEKYVLNLI